MVLDDGVSHVPAAIPAQSGAVGQVDVFVRGEEIFIEPAELLEHLSRDQTCRAAHAKNFTRGGRSVSRGSVMALERASGAEQPVASAVDDRGVVHVDDARRRKQKRRPCVDAVTQRTKPGRVRYRVVVEECQKVAARRLRAGIAAAGKSVIVTELDETHLWKCGANEVRRPVG